jgi:hypothetical protein
LRSTGRAQAWRASAGNLVTLEKIPIREYGQAGGTALLVLRRDLRRFKLSRITPLLGDARLTSAITARAAGRDP